MKHIQLFENFENEMNEATTDHYVVSSKTKKLKRATTNSREYWQVAKRVL